MPESDAVYTNGSVMDLLNRAALGDERKARGIRHPMEEILLIILLGFLLGCNSLRSIAAYFDLEVEDEDDAEDRKERIEYLKKFIDLPFGVPDSSTLSRAIKKLDPVPFVIAFADFMYSMIPHDASMPLHIGVDGKAVIASMNKAIEGWSFYIVNMFAAAYHLFLYQTSVGPKSAEASVIEQEIADILNGNPAVVTMDAMGTKKAILDIIFGCDSDAVLPIKMNNANLNNESLEMIVKQLSKNSTSVEHLVDLDGHDSTDAPKEVITDTRCTLFDEDNHPDDDPGHPISDLSFFDDVYHYYDVGQTIDLDNAKGNNLYHVKVGDKLVPMVYTHGRFERREYDLITDLDLMAEIKGLPAFLPWPQISNIGLVTRYRATYARDSVTKKKYLKVSVTRTPYLLTKPMSVEEFASTVRLHWSTEQAHNTLDESFKEDRCQARAGTSAENLSLLRKLAFNLVVVYRAMNGNGTKSLKGFERSKEHLARKLAGMSWFITKRIKSPFKAAKS